VPEAVDVDAVLGEEFGQPQERAGPVLQHGPDLDVPARLDQAAHEDGREGVHVDVAATQERHDGLVLAVVEGPLQDGRERDRAGALQQNLRPFQGVHQGDGDFGVGDRHHLIDALLDHLEGQLADLADGDPVGDRLHRVELLALALLQRGSDARGALGLDADHAGVGPALDRGGHSRDQPAAADRDDHGIHLGEFLDDFQAERPLPGHHVGVVEGVDVGAALLAGDLVGALLGLVVVDAMEDDLPAVVLGRVDLRDRSGFGHDDLGVDARPRGGQRDALGVVARARRDDARRSLGIGERVNPVRRPPDLERARALERL
jgi:hypothetical protein